jgi:hypothetical protein
MEHQLGALALVIADQCPGVQAEACITEVQVVDGLCRQLFQATAEVVAEVTDQAADAPAGNPLPFVGGAEAGKAAAQALQEVVGRFVMQRCQLCQWPGADKVIASTLRGRTPGIQQHRAGGVGDSAEIIGGVGPIGQILYKTSRHARLSYKRGRRL